MSPLGNPAMSMKMPFGPESFRSINWNIPNVVEAGIPGFESLATTLIPALAPAAASAMVEGASMVRYAEPK